MVRTGLFDVIPCSKKRGGLCSYGIINTRRQTRLYVNLKQLLFLSLDCVLNQTVNPTAVKCELWRYKREKTTVTPALLLGLANHLFAKTCQQQPCHYVKYVEFFTHSAFELDRKFSAEFFWAGLYCEQGSIFSCNALQLAISVAAVLVFAAMNSHFSPTVCRTKKMRKT